jgi:hypothetical protein
MCLQEDDEPYLSRNSLDQQGCSSVWSWIFGWPSAAPSPVAVRVVPDETGSPSLAGDDKASGKPARSLPNSRTKNNSKEPPSFENIPVRKPLSFYTPDVATENAIRMLEERRDFSGSSHADLQQGHLRRRENDPRGATTALSGGSGGKDCLSAAMLRQCNFVEKASPAAEATVTDDGNREVDIHLNTEFTVRNELESARRDRNAKLAAIEEQLAEKQIRLQQIEDFLASKDSNKTIEVNEASLSEMRIVHDAIFRAEAETLREERRRRDQSEVGNDSVELPALPSANSLKEEIIRRHIEARAGEYVQAEIENARAKVEAFALSMLTRISDQTDAITAETARQLDIRVHQEAEYLEAALQRRKSVQDHADNLQQRVVAESELLEETIKQRLVEESVLQHANAQKENARQLLQILEHTVREKELEIQRANEAVAAASQTSRQTERLLDDIVRRLEGVEADRLSSHGCLPETTPSQMIFEEYRDELSKLQEAITARLNNDQSAHEALLVATHAKEKVELLEVTILKTLERPAGSQPAPDAEPRLTRSQWEAVLAEELRIFHENMSQRIISELPQLSVVQRPRQVQNTQLQEQQSRPGVAQILTDALQMQSAYDETELHFQIEDLSVSALSDTETEANESDGTYGKQLESEYENPPMEAAQLVTSVEENRDDMRDIVDDLLGMCPGMRPKEQHFTTGTFVKDADRPLVQHREYQPINVFTEDNHETEIPGVIDEIEDQQQDIVSQMSTEQQARPVSLQQESWQRIRKEFEAPKENKSENGRRRQTDVEVPLQPLVQEKIQCVNIVVPTTSLAEIETVAQQRIATECIAAPVHVVQSSLSESAGAPVADPVPRSAALVPLEAPLEASASPVQESEDFPPSVIELDLDEEPDGQPVPGPVEATSEVLEALQPPCPSLELMVDVVLCDGNGQVKFVDLAEVRTAAVQTDFDNLSLEKDEGNTEGERELVSTAAVQLETQHLLPVEESLGEVVAENHPALETGDVTDDVTLMTVSVSAGTEPERLDSGGEEAIAVTAVTDGFVEEYGLSSVGLTPTDLNNLLLEDDERLPEDERKLVSTVAVQLEAQDLLSVEKSLGDVVAETHLALKMDDVADDVPCMAVTVSAGTEPKRRDYVADGFVEENEFSSVGQTEQNDEAQTPLEALAGNRDTNSVSHNRGPRALRSTHLISTSAPTFSLARQDSNKPLGEENYNHDELPKFQCSACVHADASELLSIETLTPNNLQLAASAPTTTSSQDEACATVDPKALSCMVDNVLLLNARLRDLGVLGDVAYDRLVDMTSSQAEICENVARNAQFDAYEAISVEEITGEGDDVDVTDATGPTTLHLTKLKRWQYVPRSSGEWKLFESLWLDAKNSAKITKMNVHGDECIDNVSVQQFLRKSLLSETLVCDIMSLFSGSFVTSRCQFFGLLRYVALLQRGYVFVEDRGKFAVISLIGLYR